MSLSYVWGAYSLAHGRLLDTSHDDRPLLRHPTMTKWNLQLEPPVSTQKYLRSSGFERRRQTKGFLFPIIIPRNCPGPAMDSLLMIGKTRPWWNFNAWFDLGTPNEYGWQRFQKQFRNYLQYCQLLSNLRSRRKEFWRNTNRDEKSQNWAEHLPCKHLPISIYIVNESLLGSIKKRVFASFRVSFLSSYRIDCEEVRTGDYHTPILTWRKSVFVRKGEQSCFTGGFG